MFLVNCQASIKVKCMVSFWFCFIFNNIGLNICPELKQITSVARAGLSLLLPASDFLSLLDYSIFSRPAVPHLKNKWTFIYFFLRLKISHIYEDFYTTIDLNVNYLSCYDWSLTLLTSTSKIWSTMPYHGLPGAVLSWNCHSRVIISSKSFHSQKHPGLKNNRYGH